VRISTVSRSQLHRTFSEAFSDYGVDMSYMSEENLRIRCVKNNVDWEASVGVFDGDRMVGFTLIGIDDWQGEMAAFDAATGIVPAFRGKGLARRMLDHALPGLRERGVARFVLEVLKGNEAAVSAYGKAGFQVSRELACFEMDTSRLTAPGEIGRAIREVERDRVDTFAGELDWHPSWEVSLAAIRRIPDHLLLFGAFDGTTCAGLIVYTPALGWIMSLIVRRAHRRRGIGSALVRHLAREIGEAGTSAAPGPGASGPEPAAVKLLNVDRSDDGMLAFLSGMGFTHWVDQFEMTRKI
jgi:ribosomal protein S18 acetylase RimI-like enzyme